MTKKAFCHRILVIEEVFDFDRRGSGRAYHSVPAERGGIGGAQRMIGPGTVCRNHELQFSAVVRGKCMVWIVAQNLFQQFSRFGLLVQTKQRLGL